MKHHFRPGWLVCSLLLLAALPVPAQSIAHAAGRASGPALVDNTRDFDTTLLGATTDRKHKIQLTVARELGDHLVQLTVALLGVGSKSSTGSTYTFTIPAGDLTVSSTGAKLDTHADLGSYGHITAQWRYTAGPTPITDNDPCSPSASASYSQAMATVSATLALTFPCDGMVKANLHGTAVAVNTGQVPLAATNASPGTPQSFYQSIYFSGDVAEKSAAGKQIVVGDYRFDTGSPLLVVGIAGPATQAIGLSQSVYFATDTLPVGAMTTSAGRSTLHYSGALGTADLTFTQKGPAISLERPAKCVVPNASLQDQSTMLATSTYQATVGGTVNLTVCVAVKGTFGSSDMGAHIATSAASTGTATSLPTPPTISGGGTSGSIGSGAIQIKKVSPPDGSTGVPTSPVISVTLSTAPSPGQVNFIVSGADNPSLVAVLPPPTYNAASMTASSTPMMPLQPNTRYKLMVVVTSTSGLSTSITTFTTGN